jgi:hypothetical protein
LTSQVLLEAPASQRGAGVESPEARRFDSGWWRQPRTLLIAVAILHALSPLVLLGVHWWFGVDETVYLSQLNAHVPAAYFSAPRARGATLIAAPITSWTSSVAAVRLWVSALSGLALYAGFAPWLRLRPGYRVPLAALMLSSLWMVTYYGFEVMPNEWVAFAVLAASGYAVRFLGDGRGRHLLWVAAAALAIALLRPSDILYGGGALALCCLFAKAPIRRRLQVIAALSAGAAIGIGEWVFEAETSYGGLFARIRAAQGEQGGGGFHFAGAAQARALAGPLLCRGGCTADAPIAYQLWWIALAVLVALAFIGRRAAKDRRVEAMLVIVGLAMAAQYVFTVTYAAPRFLIPTYALLALPAASGVTRLVRMVRAPAWRRVLVISLAGLFIANTALQVDVITANIAPSTRVENRTVVADARMLNGLGLAHPCLLLGSTDNLRLAYAAACSNSPSSPYAVRDKLAAGTAVIWMGDTKPSSFYGYRWRRVDLPGVTAGQPRVGYVSTTPLN